MLSGLILYVYTRKIFSKICYFSFWKTIHCFINYWADEQIVTNFKVYVFNYSRHKVCQKKKSFEHWILNKLLYILTQSYLSIFVNEVVSNVNLLDTHIGM